jgi:branched-chain amino acid transport system permease protein
VYDRRTLGGPVSIGLACFVLVAVPAVLSWIGLGYLFRLAQLSAIFIILSVSLNFLTGTLGLLSLSHSAFYGIGAYISALLALNGGVPFFAALLLSGLLTATIAALLAVSIVRLTRLFFAVGTLAIGELISLALLNWTDLTNGPMGVRNIPGASLFGWAISGALPTYYLCAGTMLICVWIIHRLTVSNFGTMLRASRDDDLVAAGMGLHLQALKIFVFSISCGMAGIAGALLAHTTNYISPDMFKLQDSILILTMVVIGGLGSVGGAMLGAILLILLPEALRDLGQLRMLLVGVALFASILMLPHGLIGEIYWISLFRRADRAVKLPDPK